MSLNNWENLSVMKKTTKTYELNFTKNGSAINITDWTIYFVVKEKMNDSDANAKINKKITSHLDALNGKTVITLDKDDMNINAKEYYYTIDTKDDEGNEVVLFYGRFLVKETVLQTRT